MQPTRKRAQSLPVCGGHGTIDSRISKKPFASPKKRSEKGIRPYSIDATTNSYHQQKTRSPLGKKVSKELHFGIADSNDGAGSCSDEEVVENSESRAVFPVTKFCTLNSHFSRFSNSLIAAGISEFRTDVNDLASVEDCFPIGPFLSFMEGGVSFFSELLEEKSAAYRENDAISRFIHVVDRWSKKIRRKYGSVPLHTEHSPTLTDKWTSPPRSKREQQTRRRDILREAARKHSTSKDGKPLTEQKLLSLYGHQKIQLGDQTAVTREVDPEDACDECKFLKPSRRCVLVERDRFWKRGQCVECVQRKTACSLGGNRVSKRVD